MVITPSTFNSNIRSKIEGLSDVRNSKKHDNFRRKWSQHKSRHLKSKNDDASMLSK